MLDKIIRQTIKFLLTGSKELVLHHSFPHLDNIKTDEIGIYLHIPFCKSPCMYCPYFKEKYDEKKTLPYKEAVTHEINFYKPLLHGKTVTSFYIGGGTPTTMIGNGLEDLIKSIRSSFHLKCSVSTETHPNDIKPSVIDTLKKIGVE
ncbi:MAG TPA: hypothetical protein ENI45_04590, partial [Thermoplasmatales archaeon]|nr:hypothetical protein [Thermoplasmatales archaeon]